MPTMLIIDDDPLAILSVRVAVPDWTVLEAADGLAGLDLVRRHRSDLDAILLDIAMPHLDGNWTCVQIRAEHPTIPIVPFTAHVETLPFLAELGTAVPIVKPLEPAALAAALQDRLTAAGVPIPTASPATLAFVQQHAATLEQQARQVRTTVRLALLSPSAVVGQGLRSLLAAAGPYQLLEATSTHVLHDLMRTAHCAAIIATTRDIAGALSLVQSWALPCLLIAETVLDGLCAHQQLEACRPPQPFGLLVLDAAIDPADVPRLLQQTITALRAGTTSIDPLLTTVFHDTPLSSRERDLVIADLCHLSNHLIAERLGITYETVRNYRTRLYHKLQVTDHAGLQRWARHYLQTVGRRPG